MTKAGVFLLGGIVIAVTSITAAGLGLAGAYLSPEYQAYLDFAERRHAWHQRCDAFLEVPLATSKQARECQISGNALHTEVQQHPTWASGPAR